VLYALVVAGIFLGKGFHEVVPTVARGDLDERHERCEGRLKVEELVHGRVMFYFGEKVDCDYRVDIDYEEHETANVHEGPDGFEKGRDDHLHLSHASENLEYATNS
jgi:hypothetical protein